ncbi:MAG: chromosomal replication initiator protein DnaA [Akkermansiaceae bacterium]|nr:chromosomal replication initiator protein DnaA [Akkermansiaceae bacterium]MDP4647305.1 chromosomal replication initiator protein DnaA [Akkermansiaceae bacterium]MDP4847455.1 chromosomal replication initiator protein DnaA [Akkermansiaceae bacterium]MDP4995883.1 chromosomal replication initiator protein DnaA [Akkermansiaceae bacterium]
MNNGRELPTAVGDEWSEISKLLSKSIGDDAFQRWFGSACWVGVADGQATVTVPGEIHQVWIETNYLPELMLAAGEIHEGLHHVSVAVAENSEQLNGATTTEAPAPNPRTELSGDILGKRSKAAGLNPDFSFKNFVVGANSQFAHAACQAVATKKSAGYNPLFIHGGSGLGKTHLMHGIGQEILRRRPDARVIYLTCEKFTNEFIEAIRKGDIEKFRRRYRSSDVLLIDDVQFLAGKERSQEEFFHTFNTLMDGRNQVVLTSDRPACEIKSLEPRLVSRFECGLTVELQAPQLETRIAILEKKTLEWKVTVDPTVITFLAEKIRSNVRRLEGALVRVATFASLAGESVTVEKVAHLLRDFIQEEAGRQVTIDGIQRAVAETFDIRLADMISRRRPASIAFPRQIAMYLSRSLTHNSLMEIGECFGGRDHGTVIHACKKVKAELTKQPGLRERIERIECQLKR